MKWFILFSLFSAWVLSGFLWLNAGDLDSPGVPNSTESAMFTLEDIYHRLNEGMVGVKRGASFIEPANGSGTSTMFTLNQIMAVAPVADDASGSTTSQVLTGTTFWSLRTGAWGFKTGTMPNRGGVSFTPGTEARSIQEGYYDGSGSVAGDADLVADNIASGISIFGVNGTHTGIGGNVQDTSSGDAVASDILLGKKAWVDGVEVTGTVPAGSNASGTDGSLTITIPDGLYTGSKTAMASDTDLVSGNIRSGVSIFGVAGDSNVVNTSSGDALTTDILAGKKAWVDGVELTGNGSLTGGALAPVVKTGQTTSYVTDDDGALERGKAWANPRFTDNGDGTVTDNNTGLIWLKQANAIGNLHSGFDTDGIAGDGKVEWQSAMDFVTAMNAGTYDGGVTPAGTYNDWRLPNVKELESLIDFGFSGPALSNAAGTGHWSEGDAFISVQNNYYWSSTSYAGNPSGYAWLVYLHVGYGNSTGKTSVYYYVWPVRGG